MTPKFVFTFVFALGMVVLTGCGNNVQLRGTVTFSDDDTPLSTGVVCFVSGDGRMSRGIIRSDGTYAVSTNQPGDGMPPGTYTVYLIDTEMLERIPTGNVDGDFVERTIQTVDRKYRSPTTSGITVTVDSSTRTFDFQVGRYQGRSR